MQRTCYCGEMRETHIGQRVTVMGWVQRIRDMGGVIFIDMRDREGELQVVFDAANLSPEDFSAAETLRNESVIEVKGDVRLRDEETVNPRIATGTVEVKATELKVLSVSKGLPFAIEDGINVREDLRMKYRFLDLRRPSMLTNVKFRHVVQRAAEDYLDANGFISIETPILTKSTPEGARDYLVPSRVHPGTFYALPQSPQIFKQLLMVAGVDKYYQVARCFRDEDLRADRQPEFTQIDMELSFVDQEDILVMLEELFKSVFEKCMGKKIEEPFLRMDWKTAMDVYGSDKPDLRFDLPIVDLTDIAKKCDFSVFRKAADSGGVVRAITVKGCADFTRTQIETLTKKAISFGAKGMAWIALRENGEIYSILTKYFSKELMQQLIDRVEAKPGDFILFSADTLAMSRKVMGALRLELGDMLGLRDPKQFKFLFVTEFPQFEYSEEEGRFMATHHPFTMCYEEDIQYLLSDPGRVRAQAYDVVLNGIELGSGSIRIHDQATQKLMFEALGFSDEDAQEKFGFMIDAFQYGTPPHGGFAFGLDRLVMLLVGAQSLRDVLAFPKTKDAVCLLTDAPGYVDQKQLDELELKAALESRESETGGKAKKKKTVNVDVDNVAKLSKLNLTMERRQDMKQDLLSIINFADKNAELDTSDVPITAHVAELVNVFREDESNPSMQREDILANAPSSEEGYIYVPRVVEG